MPSLETWNAEFITFFFLLFPQGVKRTEPITVQRLFRARCRNWSEQVICMTLAVDRARLLEQHCKKGSIEICSPMERRRGRDSQNLTKKTLIIRKFEIQLLNISARSQHKSLGCFAGTRHWIELKIYTQTHTTPELHHNASIHQHIHLKPRSIDPLSSLVPSTFSRPRIKLVPALDFSVHTLTPPRTRTHFF